MARTYDLTTQDRVASVKPFGSDQNSLKRLEYCLDAASEWFEGRVGRPLAEDSYARNLDSNGGRAIALPYWPATALASVIVQGASWTIMAQGSAEAGQQCMIDSSGRLLLARAAPFPRGIGAVLVTWTAGFALDDPGSDPGGKGQDVFPDDVQQAVAFVAHLLMIESARIGEGATTLGPEQVTSIARNAEKDYDFIAAAVRRWRNY